MEVEAKVEVETEVEVETKVEADTQVEVETKVEVEMKVDVETEIGIETFLKTIREMSFQKSFPNSVCERKHHGPRCDFHQKSLISHTFRNQKVTFSAFPNFANFFHLGICNVLLIFSRSEVFSRAHYRF